MRIRWRGLELPTRVDKETETETPTYAKFFVEPFERGFGTTVGNSLRRILLSSLEGCAVMSVKIGGVQHEFSSIDGVLEDVTRIILNVKSLILRCESGQPKTMSVSVKTKGEVTAAKIKADPAIEIINKDFVLCTLTVAKPFEMEMVVQRGRGYVTAAEHTEDQGDQEIGLIPIDSVYSPVTRVRYKTEDTRVGQKTNYDRLAIEIWTNGTVTPEDALVEAAKILRKHLNPFVQYAEPGEELEADSVEPEPEEISPEVSELVAKLGQPITDLDLGVRPSNCLEAAKITTLRGLVQLTEADLLKVRSFGRTSLREVKRKLSDLGLSLGMDVSDVPASTSETSEDGGTD